MKNNELPETFPRFPFSPKTRENSDKISLLLEETSEGRDNREPVRVAINTFAGAAEKAEGV